MGDLGEKLGLGLLEMAQGILDVVNAKMANSIRTVTYKRGLDARSFTVVAYGGAGPMHATAIADALDINEVIIPNSPGTFSAWGMLQTDLRHDLRETFYRPLVVDNVGEMEEAFKELASRGRELLSLDKVDTQDMELLRFVDMRYEGQEYSLTVPVQELTADSMRDRFHEAYLQRYGHASPSSAVEIVRLRLTVVGRLPRPKQPEGSAPEDRPPVLREVYFDGQPVGTHVVARESLAPRALTPGPLIVEEPTATTVLPPSWSCTATPQGHLVLSRKAE